MRSDSDPIPIFSLDSDPFIALVRIRFLSGSRSDFFLDLDPVASLASDSVFYLEIRFFL